jgi:hypothetical protein
VLRNTEQGLRALEAQYLAKDHKPRFGVQSIIKQYKDMKEHKDYYGEYSSDMDELHKEYVESFIEDVSKDNCIWFPTFYFYFWLRVESGQTKAGKLYASASISTPC